MIKLRKLEIKDADFMLEWMNYEETKTIFLNDFSLLSKEDVLDFIKGSIDDKNINLAIVDDIDDEYLGTISLKNIDKINNNAEYAISTRHKSRRNNINYEASKKILSIAFDDLKLEKIYLNVISENKRAIKFYQKLGFTYEGTFKKHVKINHILSDLEWYSILLEDYKVLKKGKL